MCTCVQWDSMTAVRRLWYCSSVHLYSSISGRSVDLSFISRVVLKILKSTLFVFLARVKRQSDGYEFKVLRCIEVMFNIYACLFFFNIFLVLFMRHDHCMYKDIFGLKFSFRIFLGGMNVLDFLCAPGRLLHSTEFPLSVVFVNSVSCWPPSRWKNLVSHGLERRGKASQWGSERPTGYI